MIADQIKAIEAEHYVRIEIDADLFNEVLNLPNTQLPCGKFWCQIPWSSRRSFGNFRWKNTNVALLFVIKIQQTPTKLRFQFVTETQRIWECHQRKVLVARLEDGEFFLAWRPKIGYHFRSCRKLNHVTFLMRRLVPFVNTWFVIGRLPFSGRKLVSSVDETVDLARAAAIYKFDLLTVRLVSLMES